MPSASSGQFQPLEPLAPQPERHTSVEILSSMQDFSVAGAFSDFKDNPAKGDEANSQQTSARCSTDDKLLSHPVLARERAGWPCTTDFDLSHAQAAKPPQIWMPQPMAYSSLRGALGDPQDLEDAPQSSQTTAQYFIGAEQNTTGDNTIEFGRPLPAQTHHDTITPTSEQHNKDKPAYEYKLYVDQYSITLVHAEPTVGIEGIGPTVSTTKDDSNGGNLTSSRLYQLATKYSGGSLPSWMPTVSQARAASDEEEFTADSNRKGPGESCVMCSSSKRRCPAALGGLCTYCEDARPHPLPTVYSLPQRGTGQKSKLRKLLKKADRVFRLYAAGTSYLSPAEESALRKVVKVGTHKGNICLLPSGAFVLV